MKSVDPHCLVFLDESSAKTNMTRRYGRAAAGERTRDSVPTAIWNTTTMLAGVRAGGAEAPFVLGGPMDGEAFEVYVDRVLAPTLRPGDIVVLDNLSTHKNRWARERIEAAGARVMDLPPYSPDLNPIEKMWSKVKAILRRIKARTPEELVAAVGEAIGAVTPEDIRGWFLSCGYNIY